MSLVERWRALPKPVRVLLLVAVTLLAVFTAPELLPLLDVGGIELALLVIVSYHRPIFRFLSRQARMAALLWHCWTQSLARSMLVLPRIFALHAPLVLALCLVSGGVVAASMFWLPALLPS